MTIQLALVLVAIVAASGYMLVIQHVRGLLREPEGDGDAD